jgi:hypothetical protein
MTFAEAAEAVLADTRRAMTADEIWVEIERRGSVETAGKTPAATLYTEMMRKSANWRGDDDDRPPLFYRNGHGAFGRWADLAPEQRKAIVASADAPSPTMVWRELHDKVKDEPSWRERISSLAAKRAKAGAEIAAWIRKYLDQAVTLEALRAEFDQRTRTDWGCFGFGGTGFAMMLNMVTKTVAAHPGFEPVVRTAMTVPRDDDAARANLRALASALQALRETGNKRRLPHPNRVPQLFSALWQVQAPEAWPTYYKSARDALDETDVVAPSEDPIESYLAFRTPYKQLASELGVSMLEFEQLCRLQQEAGDDPDAEEEAEAGDVAAWLFQCRPDSYDLRGAVEQLSELTWMIRTHRKRIHDGDTVYLWESGPDAALIARGTITSEPAPLSEDSSQRRFYRDPTAADGEALRVWLHVDRVVRPPLTRRQIVAAPELADVQVFRSAQGTNFRLDAGVAAALEVLIAQQDRAPERRYWKISPGTDAEKWPTMERESVIAVSWNKQSVGDLRGFATKSELEQRFATMYPELSERKRRSRVEQLWTFREIAVGDVIVANRGFSKVVGEGIVTGGYFYRPDHPSPHARPVRWERTDEREVENQGPRWRSTVVPLTAEQYDALFDEEPEPPPPPPPPPEPQPGRGPGPSAALPYTLQDALKQVFLSHADLARLVDLLKYKKNLVLQGPPGVGKTFVAAELAYVLLGSKDDSRIKRVQFHQSYAYEDFVRGYRPAGGGFEYRDGPMFAFCEQARRDDRPHVMIIDEINRGNLSKILGELMLLIEPDKREPRWQVELAYAKPGELPFWVPPNVYIIGTMNTADRSIALVDYALRRRFVFATVPPAFGLGGFEQFLEDKGVAAALRTKIVTRIAELNAAIEKDTRNLGRGYVIGHSYFCQPDPEGAYDATWYERIVKFEIEPLLDEYWAESPDKAKAAVTALLGP